MSCFHCSIIKAKHSTEKLCTQNHGVWVPKQPNLCANFHAFFGASFFFLPLLQSFCHLLKTLLKTLQLGTQSRILEVFSRRPQPEFSFVCDAGYVIPLQCSNLWAGKPTGRWSSRRLQVCNVAKQVAQFYCLFYHNFNQLITIFLLLQMSLQIKCSPFTELWHANCLDC